LVIEKIQQQIPRLRYAPGRNDKTQQIVAPALGINYKTSRFLPLINTDTTDLSKACFLETFY